MLLIHANKYNDNYQSLSPTFEKKQKEMSKTLIVSYTPRIGSYTKQLLDEWIKLSKNKTQITHTDLVSNPPDLLLADNLSLIMEWNQGKRAFSSEESALLANHHQLIDQLLESDYIVLACPMYNFSMPATVKAWIDAIVVSDKTFSFTPQEGFKGLCGDKKALILMVSGFSYDSSTSNKKEYASSTLKANFDFMGIPSQQISAFGVDEKRDQLDTILAKAKTEIQEVVQQWYL